MNAYRESYKVRYNDKEIGYYRVEPDGSAEYSTGWGCPWDIGEALEALGLDRERKGKAPFPPFRALICDARRVPGRRRILYRDGPVTLERVPRETGERFSVYRRAADETDPDYSPLPHDAAHYEGPNTPEDMREWASWYAFNRMDDGTYEAELDEAWWWGGGHNDGGTIHKEIPEEWFELPYEEFLHRVVGLAAAAHYGFTAEQLMSRRGLKEFFGFDDK